MISVFYYFPS